jgi:hypothetical protein
VEKSRNSAEPPPRDFSGVPCLSVSLQLLSYFVFGKNQLAAIILILISQYCKYLQDFFDFKSRKKTIK